MFGTLVCHLNVSLIFAEKLNMAKQAQTFFLENWLGSHSGCSSNFMPSSSSSSARAIIQAWADLRDCFQKQSFGPQHLQSLESLINSQASLYVADPQANVLLSILSSTSISPPPESYPLLFRLLYIWIRKSSKPSLELIDLAIKVISHLVSTCFDSKKSSYLFCEVVVLLGALSFSPSVSEKSKTLCLELLCKLLEENNQFIRSSEQHTLTVLAGIAYALSSSGNVYFVRIMDSLFRIWNREDGPHGSVSDGLLILHMIEWVLSNFICSHSLSRVEAFSKFLTASNPHHASFAVVMAAAGALRASSRSALNALRQLRISAEEKIETIARGLISGTGSLVNSGNDPQKSLLFRGIALALARSGAVSFRPPLLICIVSALLTEIFPLQTFYTRVLQYQNGSLVQFGLNEVKELLNSAPFKEAGAITGAFCNQYASADEENRHIVESLIWKYCQDVYSGHRQVAWMLRGREDELLVDLEKIAESAFLMVVVFALSVTKHKLNTKLSQELQMDISVKILVSFSCMEYFRRMRLPEYMDTIRAIVVPVQQNESACVSFVESMPSYSDLTGQRGIGHISSLVGTCITE